MDVFTRHIIGVGVERTDIDGAAICRMFDHAITGQALRKHLSTDHDRCSAAVHRSLGGTTPA